jgi:hypothetical protein
METKPKEETMELGNMEKFMYGSEYGKTTPIKAPQ